MDFEGEK